VRAIARELGLSKSAVHRVLLAEPEPEPDDDEDPDDDGDGPWEDDGPDPLALFDTDEERWPVPPLTFVGYERQWFSRGKGNGGYWGDMERWLDANGDRVGSEYESAGMALYRLANHYRHDLDDHEGADALERDWQRQRDEYEQRARVR
jgi:hypothetical protein